MKQFTLNKVLDHFYEIIHSNGKIVGGATRLEDGYFHIKLFSNGGYWSDDSLIEIGTIIKELNKPWDDQVRNDLDFLEEEFKKVIDDELPF